MSLALNPNSQNVLKSKVTDGDNVCRIERADCKSTKLALI